MVAGVVPAQSLSMLTVHVCLLQVQGAAKCGEAAIHPLLAADPGLASQAL